LILSCAGLSRASIGYYDIAAHLGGSGFHLGWALLVCLGLLLAHASSDVLNDYFDFRTGIDLVTRRTPFSGGSGLLPRAS